MPIFYYDYDSEDLLDQEKYRLILKSGDDFKDKYLERFSDRESVSDFAIRKKITPVPAYARVNLLEIRNSIYDRLLDISRTGGSASYQAATQGYLRGVDLQGSNMTYFMAYNCLLELLAMKRVAIYVDNYPDVGLTRADARGKHPYIYMYEAENIVKWEYNDNHQLSIVKLRDSKKEGAITKHTFRQLELTDEGVLLTITDYSDSVLDTQLLLIAEIPVSILEISHSLLKDAADYQIAMMNMESSDILYAMKSNFPFYVEQYHNDATDYLAPAPGIEGQTQGPSVTNKKIEVGGTQGRRYGKGLDAPAFINPSPEPLQVSMEKQEKMEQTIRKLMGLALQGIRSSADSKDKDKDSLKSGLLYISMELERAENEIARFWAMYEGSEPANIVYPKSFDDKSEEEEITQAEKLKAFMPISSILYRRELAKEVVRLTIGKRVPSAMLIEIYKQIDKLDIIALDAADMREDIEIGILDRISASIARGYPAGVAEKAKVEHIERLEAIARAQSDASIDNLSARGLDDTDPDASSDEKRKANDRDMDPESRQHYRGKGKK